MICQAKFLEFEKICQFFAGVDYTIIHVLPPVILLSAPVIPLAFQIPPILNPSYIEMIPAVDENILIPLSDQDTQNESKR